METGEGFSGVTTAGGHVLGYRSGPGVESMILAPAKQAQDGTYWEARLKKEE